MAARGEHRRARAPLFHLAVLCTFAECNADHLLDRRILNREIRHGEIGKQSRARRRRDLARHLDRRARRREVRDAAVLLEPCARHGLGQHELDALDRRDARDELRQLAIIEQPPRLMISTRDASAVTSAM